MKNSLGYYFNIKLLFILYFTSDIYLDYTKILICNHFNSRSNYNSDSSLSIFTHYYPIQKYNYEKYGDIKEEISFFLKSNLKIIKNKQENNIISTISYFIYYNYFSLLLIHLEAKPFFVVPVQAQSCLNRSTVTVHIIFVSTPTANMNSDLQWKRVIGMLESLKHLNVENYEIHSNSDNLFREIYSANETKAMTSLIDQTIAIYINNKYENYTNNIFLIQYTSGIEEILFKYRSLNFIIFTFGDLPTTLNVASDFHIGMNYTNAGITLGIFYFIHKI